MITAQTLNWDQIDTVLLDMDGTLLDLNYDNFFWQRHVPLCYAKTHSVTEAEAWTLFHDELMRVKGTLAWYDVHYWSEFLRLDIIALTEEVAHLIRLRPGALEFLHAVQQVGKRLVLATNAHEDTITLKFSRIELESYFDTIVASNQLGSPKEDVEFWQLLQGLIGFDPARCLFIDDSTTVLNAAKRFGIAYLMTIRRPDLEQPAQEANGFFALDHFDQILPEIYL